MKLLVVAKERGIQQVNNRFYYCYSYPQKKFLVDNGLRYIIKGIHPNSGKTYWVFDRNDILLDELLTKWKNQ